jgi:hypothetical protein
METSSSGRLAKFVNVRSLSRCPPLRVTHEQGGAAPSDIVFRIEDN